MRELAVRLSMLDPEAGAALRVISYYDELVKGRAGLRPIVRGAAVLTGSAAGLVDPERSVALRVSSEGAPTDCPPERDPAWLSVQLGSPGSWLWIERTGPARGVDAMVLERAGAAAQAVLERTRGRAASPVDPAFVETALDPAAPDLARVHAARALLRGSDHGRVVATSSGATLIEPDAAASSLNELEGVQAGVGPEVALLDLPASHRAALVALRFTAAGTDEDPGPRVVRWDDLGALALLADVTGPGGPAPDDVRLLNRAATDAPWLLTTLVALCTTASSRAAAGTLHVHHSTFQHRVTRAEHLLGWKLSDPQVRLRLHATLLLRRLSQA